MIKNVIHILLTTFFLFSSLVQAAEIERSSSPEGARAYIISPADGEVVGESVTIKFGLRGMGVAPAGFDKENTGHHHLIIDAKELPAFDQPMNADVIHFGGGQTEHTVKLAKGEHTLQLILGNYLHVPHNPAVTSEKISITVE